MKWPLMVNNITNEDADTLIEFLSRRPLPVLTNSCRVREFEDEWSKWLGVKYSVFVNSGSSANILTMLILKELYESGEIITTPLGWVSDIAAILHSQLTPVFCDIKLDTLSIDEDKIIEKITPNTKAILLTHILGYNGISQKLLNICSEKNILLIEDCCLPAGEKIITNKGYKNIEHIKEGDVVLSHTGTFRRVLSTTTRKYSNTLHEFYTYGSSIKTKLTHNHPILCCKTKNIKKNKSVEWTSSENVKEKDYLVFPRYKITQDIEKITLSDINGVCSNSKYQKIFESRLKETVSVDKNLMTIIGWYLAEGFSSKQHVEFSLGSHEEQNISDLCSAITAAGFDCDIRKRSPKSSVTSVCLWSKQMAQWLPDQFGDSCYTKHIPEWIINLPSDKLDVLLDAYTKGDGCKIKNRISNYSITSVSLNLLSSIKIICSKLGYYCGITQTTKSGTSTILGRPVTIVDKYQLRYSKQQNNPLDRRVHIDDDYFYIRVKKIKLIPSDETVYNFEVEIDNSYCTPAFAVHNCESHGATFQNKKIGSFGYISNFSFYYAHHMTSIEGGMICTNDELVYNLARSFRSHAMLREMDSPHHREQFKTGHDDLNKDFIFIAPAYNMRSTEINAVLALNQLKRLDENNIKRAINLNVFLNNLDSSKYYTDFNRDGNSNYAFTLLLKNPDLNFRDKVESTLNSHNIEFRRGMSGGGNQLRQPYLKRIFGDEYKKYPVCDHVHFYGWYIGNYPELEHDKIVELCNLLNNI